MPQNSGCTYFSYKLFQQKSFLYWPQDTKIPAGASAGIPNGLELLIDVESFETVGMLSNGLTGFRMSLMNPQDIAFISDSAVSIAPGTK